MARKLSDNPKGSKAPRIGEGGYAARVVQIIRLGTQRDEYEGKVTHKLKVWCTFEIPDVTIEVDGEDRPRWMSAKETESSNEKARFQKLCMAVSQHQEVVYEADLLNGPVMIDIGSTNKNNDKITGYAAVPASFVKGIPELANPAVFWDIDEPDYEQFEKFPDFIKDMIREAPEWVEPEGGDSGAKTKTTKTTKSKSDDDNPFE